MGDDRGRASGRTLTVSSTELLERRTRALITELESGVHSDFRAFCFASEQSAWSVLQLARALLFEKRSPHLPSSDSEVFAAWVKQEWLGRAESRRLKQFCELRHLSSHDPEKLLEDEIRASVRDGLPLITTFLATAHDVLNRK